LNSGIYHIEIRYFNELWEPTSVCERDLAVLGNNNLNQNDLTDEVMLEPETIHLQNQFSIYPNPAKDNLFVKFLEQA